MSKLFRQLFIFTFFLPIITWAESQDLGLKSELKGDSEFTYQSLRLITNKNSVLSLERLIAILDKDAPATANEEAILHEIHDLSKNEDIKLNFRKIKELEKKIRSYQMRAWATPAAAITAGIFVNTYTSTNIEPSILLIIKIIYDSLALKIVWDYLPELKDSSDSHTQEMKRKLASHILLSKIQMRIFRKEEGFPWPFVDNPSCEQVLRLKLKEIKIN